VEKSPVPLLFVAIALLLSHQLAGQSIALTPIEMLDQYEHGTPSSADAFVGIIHVESVKNDLQAEGESWIVAAGPKAVPRRRLVAATFALEAARAGLDYEWTNSIELIDWGWSQLRKQNPPLPAERLWHLAAIALFEGAYDQEELEPRLGRINSRFPKEPRILLADAWSLESLRGRPGFPPPRRGKPGGIGDTGSNIVAAYKKALASPDAAVAGEADLRLGYYDLIADRSDSALTRLAHALSATREPELMYLGHLFRGWALSRLDRDSESTAEYQQAVDAVPAGGTGALWLARRLLLEGKRAEADAVTDRSLTGSRNIDDPWRLYGLGDFRRFPALIQQLREANR
jgi:tetratricopeptide (TPR) repeat protein